MTTGRISPGDKDTWWWNDEVKEAKRALKKRGQEEAGRIRKEGRERYIYRQTTKEAKKKVARSKARAMD